MKSLLLVLVLLGLAAAVLFVPIQGRTLWSRGVVKQAAQLAAAGLRKGWNFVEALGRDHEKRTPEPPAHSPSRKKPAQAAAPKPSRDGIVPQPPKEQLHKDDQAALQELIAHSR